MVLCELIAATGLDGIDILGNKNIDISGVAEIFNARKGDLTFAIKPCFMKQVYDDCDASAVIVPRNFTGKENSGLCIIKADDPYHLWAECIRVFAKPVVSNGVISEKSCVSANSVIGENVSIGPFVVIEEGVIIGDNTIIKSNCHIGRDCRIGKDNIFYPNVVVREECIIGDSCMIHSGVAIGGDGYGFVEAKSSGAIVKVPQIGIVRIGNNVEIGANSTVDRAAVGVTEIGDNTKIDNLVQIAHNVKIGENCFIVAQSGISGSTEIGNAVKIAGQSGIVGHLKIGDNATIAARSVVMSNVPSGEIYSGFPARPHKVEMKIKASLKRLPEIVRVFFKLKRSDYGNKICGVDKIEKD